MAANTSVEELKIEFARRIGRQGSAGTIELRNDGVLLRDGDWLRGLRCARLEASFESDLTFLVKGEILKIERLGRTVADYKDEIRKRRGGLTGTIDIYYKGRIFADSIRLDHVLRSDSTPFEVLHVDPNDVDLQPLQRTPQGLRVEFMFHRGDEHINIKFPPKTTVRAALREVVKHSIGRERAAKHYRLECGGTEVADTELLDRIEPKEGVVVRRGKRLSQDIPVRSEVRQRIGRIVESNRLMPKHQERLLRFYSHHSDMREVERLANKMAEKLRRAS
jgi:hypothetical protein